MFKGCYTALITPFSGDSIDYKGLDKLIDFQISGNISGILAVGTTGESPTLSWEEHNSVIEIVAERTKGKCFCIAGTGSNNTAETLKATKHAFEVGAEAALLVDPYYNGPSSLEIKNEYISPVAKAFPNFPIIPYIIPGRTGTQLFPEDLALLNKEFPNVLAVKEATGSIDNMRRTRNLCGPTFTILSGDDDKTFEMMTDPKIMANGVFSVVSNVAPAAVQKMTMLLLEGQRQEAENLMKALKPLFSLVTVKTIEETAYGPVECRARNPLGLKILMAILGMPSGPCRQPMGKITKNGFEKVLNALKTVQADNPEILAPAAEFFEIDINARLNDSSCCKELIY
ncbi:4-hydroxy-tetrahydrodipicolinate synthase [Candidatus Magnetomoraceae bacterium gMMP-15]